MKRQQTETTKEKETTNDQELMDILTSKVTIIFVKNLDKFIISTNYLNNLKSTFNCPVELLNESDKWIAEAKVISSTSTHIFIADFDVYNVGYSFGDVNIIASGEEILNNLKAVQETKIEVISKK